MSGLQLEVLDFADESRWRWLLTDADGVCVADHQVGLDTSAWQFEAFSDAYGFLQRNATPARRLAHEAEIVQQLGDWIAIQVLGPVGVAIARRRKPVRLMLPPEAAALGYRPWELARIEGRALPGHRVNVLIDQQPHYRRSKAGVGNRLRMLAVFSLPEDAGALNLRKERFQLARLMQQIAMVNNKAIELRVVQYGASRRRLEEALLEADGWDVVHLSGHGLPAGLVLEEDTGRHDLVSSDELVDLLDLASDRIKLVMFSACESAAVTAAEHLEMLGLAAGRDSGAAAVDLAGPDGGAAAASAAVPGFGGGWLPGLAAKLVDRLDCAVLAMRFPVVDDFAIVLAGSFYDLVLGKGQPVPRALALSLGKVAPVTPMPGAPALSIGTPTLFGARAEGLVLPPPPGGPVVFAAERQKLAGFPPQPERFVGRVGPMARATTVLAPGSGQVGVLFHGMAGAGKTACALELAYTHHESFPLLAWHAAPPQGTDISGALTDFALALERQLPGLKLVHLMSDTAALRDILPRLTGVLEQNRVLIVLDSIESLLTETGSWSDERWGLLVDALTAHRGLSRLILTGRHRPAALSPGMLVEPVLALSLQESVLLAREWPHLHHFIDGTDLPAQLTPEQARGLASRTLRVVQGHPKLIELADRHANDPAALLARLDEADRAWLTQGTRLFTFLARRESSATDEDYLASQGLILQGWTRATAAALPQDSAILFQFLACLEEEDRVRRMVEDNWADVWRRLELPGECPNPDTALGPLMEHALVAADPDPDTGKPAWYGIHPGVSETARQSADSAFTTAVDTHVANYWLSLLRDALAREGSEDAGSLVRRAARSAAPYLVRQHRWNDLDVAAQQLLHRDPSTATVAALLPMLTAATDAVAGTNIELEVRLGRTHANALRVLDTDQAETRYRRLLDTAVEYKLFSAASLLTGDLINLYGDRGRLEEALALTDQAIDYTRRAGHGPWTQLLVEVRRLQVLYRQGYYQQVLEIGQQLRTQMAMLPDPPAYNDSTINPINVRELLLNIMGLAARNLGRWQQALDLNNELGETERRRGASDAEQAATAFNNYPPLLGLGRVAEARQLLYECRLIFQDNGDVSMLSKTLTALAQVEARLEHLDLAVDLQQDALRYEYLARDPRDIAASHNNLARFLARAGSELRQVGAHHLAAAIITYQTGHGLLTSTLAAIGRLLAQDTSVVPTSFAEVRQIVEQVDGVHLAELVDQLPRRAPDSQAALDQVLHLALETEN